MDRLEVLQGEGRREAEEASKDLNWDVMVGVRKREVRYDNERLTPHVLNDTQEVQQDQLVHTAPRRVRAFNKVRELRDIACCVEENRGTTTCVLTGHWLEDARTQ